MRRARTLIGMTGLPLAITAAVVAVAAVVATGSDARAATNPYARLPAVGDHVRFDGSAAGEKNAWAYPNLNYLEAFLRSTIDASLTSTTYEEYQKKMELVLAKSASFDNGTHGVVENVQAFSYRGHDDTEVQVRLTGQDRAAVWTTPAELVDSSGRKYLR